MSVVPMPIADAAKFVAALGAAFNLEHVTSVELRIDLNSDEAEATIIKFGVLAVNDDGEKLVEAVRGLDLCR